MTQTYNDHDFSLRVLKRIILQWLTGGEASPETPWQTEEAGPLAFGPGVLWANGAVRTLEMSYEPYELGVGDPQRWLFGRRVQFSFDSDGLSPVNFAHDFHQVPLVQVLEALGGDTWRVVDVIAAGGYILHGGFDDVTIDFGGALAGLVVMVG